MTPESSSVVWGTTTIQYAIRRTARRKTVAIVVDAEDGVVLAAPHDASLDRLDAVVRRKASWIVGAIRASSDRPPPPTSREFVSGESFLYAGRQHALRVVVDQPEGTSLDHGRLVVRLPASESKHPETVRDQLVEWYRARADERLRDLVAVWSERIGLHPTRVVIASQQRRWGSCSPSGQLRLNWRIVGASKRLVEYVIAHELMHLRHPDHTPAFWRALARVMPDSDARRSQLREIGPRLVW
jgi:predicted metal-dependent hydrolase